MDLAHFTQLMEARGCVHQDKSFCGVYQGWPYSVRFLRGGAQGTTFSLRVDFERVPAALFNQLRDTVQGQAKMQRMNGDSASTLFASVAVPNDADFEQVFDALLPTLAHHAGQAGLSLPQYCALCSRPGCNAFAGVGGGYQPVHAACVLQASAAQQIKVQQNEVNGSYGLGILGALLGGLVGAVPIILFEVFYTGLLYGWMYAIYALIPLAAHRGYLLLRGKRTWRATLVIVAVSLLLVPVVSYLSTALANLKAWDYFPSVADYPYAFGGPASGELWYNLGLTFAFAGFGILVVLGIISRGNKDTWNEAAFSAATLQPMPAAGAPAGGDSDDDYDDYDDDDDYDGDDDDCEED